MQQAIFKIKSYRFNKVNLNLDVLNTDSSLEIEFQTKSIFYQEKKTFELSFVCDVFNENEDINKLVSVSCIVEYEFDNNLTLEDIPNYFYSSSLAIVFPYVRSYISMLTMQSNITNITLPLLNLTNHAEKIKESTIVM